MQPITVVIPTYNEEPYIERCLESLLRQTYRGELYVIVADGGSTDDTRAIVTAVQKKHPGLKLIDNPDKHQAEGRNRAIKEAKTRLVAYIDAHSYAEEDWLQRLYDAYQHMRKKDPQTVGVGSIHRDAARTPFSLATTAAMSSVLGSGGQSYQPKQTLQRVDTAYACLYDKERIEEVGLYDPQFVKGQDLELNLRLKQAGYNLYLEPRAITYYYKRESYKALARQVYRYGYWRWKVMRHRKEYLPVSFAPPLFNLGLATLLILSLAWQWWILPGALAIYALALITETGRLSIRDKTAYWRTPIMFAIIHTTYGAGMLWSMLGQPERRVKLYGWELLGRLLKDPEERTEQTNAKRILVVNLQGIGDYIMTTPLAHTLTKNARVDILTLNPAVTEIVSADYMRVLLWKGPLRTWNEVRKNRYDLTILAHGAGPKSALFFKTLPGKKASHIYNLGGYETSFGADTAVKQTPKMHRVEENLKLLAATGQKPPRNPEYHVETAEAARQQAEKFWKEHGLRTKTVIGIHPGGDKANPEKRYPLEDYKTFADNLSKSSHKALFFIGPDEEELAAQLQDYTIAQEPLATTAALIEKCALLIHADSGLGHLAAAVKTPTVTLAGRTNWERTKPYHDQDTLLKHPDQGPPAEWRMEEGNINEEGKMPTNIPATSIIRERN